jgi:sortase B
MPVYIEQTAVTPMPEINYGSAILPLQHGPPPEQFVQMAQTPKLVTKPLKAKANMHGRPTDKGKALYRIMISAVCVCFLVSVAILTTRYLESSTAKREIDALSSMHDYETQTDRAALNDYETAIITPQNEYGSNDYYSGNENYQEELPEYTPEPSAEPEVPQEDAGLTQPPDEAAANPPASTAEMPITSIKPQATPDPSFSGLIQANPDVAGWIKVPGTSADNPVMQSGADDPNFYLYNDYYGQSSSLGAIYADAQNLLGPEETSQNITLYGHRAKNGTMFGDLKYYLGLDFYKKNPVFSFDTLYEESKWVIFAVFVIDADNNASDYFEWRQPYFDSNEDFNTYVDACKQRSYISASIDVTPQDRLINLVTCTYEFDNARLVLIARKVRDGEVIDVSSAVMNPSPLYPKQLSD